MIDRALVVSGFIALGTAILPLDRLNARFDGAANEPSINQSSRNDCAYLGAVLRPIWSELFQPGDVISRGTPPIPIEALHRPTGDIAVPMSPVSLGWSQGWTGEAPSRELVKQWYAKRRSVGSCLQHTVKQPRLAVIEETEGLSLLRKHAGSGSGPTLVHVSYPIFDKAKQRAIVTYSSTSHNFSARVEFYLLKRVHGAWMLAGSRLISIA